MKSIKNVLNMENKIKQALEEGSIPESKDYSCPHCHTRYPEDDYVVDGEKFPKYYNEFTSFYEDVDWTEVHKCPNCGTLYYFNNGN